MIENMNIFALGRALENIRQLECIKKTLPARACATQQYINSLQRGIEDISTEDAIVTPPEGALAQIAGVPFHVSSSLPKGVLCILFDKEGKPLQMIVDLTYEAQQPPLPKEPTIP